MDLPVSTPRRPYRWIVSGASVRAAAHAPKAPLRMHAKNTECGAGGLRPNGGTPFRSPERSEGENSALGAAKAAIPTLELAHGVVHVLAREVGPQRVGEDQLAVGQLPQEEIRDPVLARCSDDEVRIWHLGVIEALADGAFVDLLGRHLVGDDVAHGIDDLGPAAVVEGDGQRHASVLLGQRPRLVHALDDAAGYSPVPTPDEADANAPVVELFGPADEDLLVEVDEEPDLVGRASPVLGGERVDGEPLH